MYPAKKPLDKLKKPPWIRVRFQSGDNSFFLKKLKSRNPFNTVCESAMCPNISECWENGNATFLILGNICTRNCAFCAVESGKAQAVDLQEPSRIAEAARALSLKHVVITSVTRDDLPDGGAQLFAETVNHIHNLLPNSTIEVLTPDFNGQLQSLHTVVNSPINIFAHNMETVPRLYFRVRPQADYNRSLKIIRAARKMDFNFQVKSGIMVGLGETWGEILRVMDDIRKTGADILTLGQYLQPGPTHLPVERYYTPEEFEILEHAGYNTGFLKVVSGPLVRSSYPSKLNEKNDDQKIKYRLKRFEPTNTVSQS